MMIKGQKRALEKTFSDAEPIKRKTPKYEGVKKFSSENGRPKSGKFSKGTTKPMTGKFQNKDRKNDKFGGKPGAKPALNEKTDWNKFKQEKKDLKLKRKKGKDTYEVSIEAKQLYEKLKCRREAQKHVLVEKLYNLLCAGDTIQKLVMAHDTARIIQCMLKYATPSLREQISEKLLPLCVSMAASKYSHFCVLRMLKYGSPKTKAKLVDSIFGNVVRLACHNISSKILDHIYLSIATPKQKIFLRQEFYGDLYKNAKDDNVKNLADTYKDTSNMKASILGSVKSNLEHVANKNLVDNSLVHAVMLEYLHECDEEKMEETVTMFSSLVPLMLTTKAGCDAAIICFYKATPKNRRAIVKNIKEHLVKICTHEHGHIFILTLLNTLDDTKATKKAIYDTIHPELQTLMSNQWGRRVIEWLISPADTNCFHPTFIATIEDGLKYGKKEKEVRRKEIFEQIEEPIATAIADQPEFWFSDRHIGLVTSKILNKISSTNFVNASTALTGVVVNPEWTVKVESDSKEKKVKKVHDVEKIIAEATKLKKKKQKAAKGESTNDESDDDDEEAVNVEETTNTISVVGIEDTGLHIILKKIIKNDKERLAENADLPTFGSLLVQKLTEETLRHWLTLNRGCFVLLNIVENNNESTKEELKTLLKPLKSILKSQQASNGAQLLLKKLSL